MLMSSCNHEEADTPMFLHAKYAKSNIVIKTVDTDVVILTIFCFKLLEFFWLWEKKLGTVRCFNFLNFVTCLLL